MGLDAIADKIDRVIEPPSTQVEVVDARTHTLDLLRHIFSKRLQPDSALQIGEALEAGALAVETERSFSPGTVSVEALRFLEDVVGSYRKALIERMGADPDGRPDINPVDFSVQYYLAHNRFPEAVDKATIAAALRKLASLPKK